MSTSIRSRSRVWVVVTPVAAFVVLFACGKFGSSEPDVAAGDSGPDGLIGAYPPDQLALGDGSSGADAYADGSAEAASACTFNSPAPSSSGAGSTASSGSTGSTGSTGGSTGTTGTIGPSVCAESYSCTNGPVTLSCSCITQACTCNGTTVGGSFVCIAGICAISAAQRTACGLPAAGPDAGL
jgi:hypothetical protein